MVTMSNPNGIGGGANSYLFAYDANNNPVGGTQVYFYAAANASKCAVGVEINGDIVRMESTGWTSSAPYSPYVKTLISDKGSAGNIKSVEINSNGGAFAVGTVIKIYGVVE